MKIIDQNGRLFGKISIVDLLAIALVVALGAALYVKRSHNEITSTTSDVTITYQVLAQGIRTYVGEAVQVGDQLYEQDYSTGGSLGTIVDVEIMPGRKIAELKDGTVEFIPVEDGVNLLLTVEGTGLVSDGRYLLNRVYDLGVNASRNFYTKYAQFAGVVHDIF